MLATPARETLEFQAEVPELLSLMIHSLYGNKEIFLRELISNASDACDRLRFEAIHDPVLLDGEEPLHIRVDVDAAAGTITVSDNGIGMSRQEVIEHIGTIAKSGTRDFLRRLGADAAANTALIGQFGLGFYASFLVAGTVTLVTRRAGLAPDDAVRWESSGEAAYSIETVRKDTRGTDVILHLRPSEREFLSGAALRRIARKYSDHIGVPIRMKKEQWDETTHMMITTQDDEQVNDASALWTRPKSQITETQYHDFYKHVTHDFEPPLAYSHVRAEGRHEYTHLLFIPRHAPYDIWDRQSHQGIKLYIRRVLVMEHTERLMPAYLRFVRGIVDSTDLPLNVSREILQESRELDTICAASAKRILALLEDLVSMQPESYATFWKEFGRVFKEGVTADATNREQIVRLLRFASTRGDTDAQTVSLADYAGRMHPKQKAIYYITADGFSAAQSSPHLEVFRKQGVEVLLMYDRVDEWVVSSLIEFDGRPLRSVAKGDLDLTDLDDAASEPSPMQDDDRELLDRLQETLKNRARSVRATKRLTDSPACIVSDEHEMSANLERLLKAAGRPVPAPMRVLEINTEHPLVARLKGESDASRFADWGHHLFDQAVLAEGGQLDDTARFIKRLNSLLLTFAAQSESRVS